MLISELYSTVYGCIHLLEMSQKIKKLINRFARLFFALNLSSKFMPSMIKSDFVAL